MENTKKNTNKKKIVIAALLFAAAVAILAGLYIHFKPGVANGAKAVTIEVTDDAGETTTYTVDTQQEYLRGVLEETEGLTIEGTESAYGLMIETVNGLYADYEADQAYWSIYVDGEYGSYGVDSQPVEDGQTFSLVYTVG